MNMFKPTAAKTVQEYLSMIEEPRHSEVQKVYDFICEALPDWKPYICVGMIGWGTYHYKGASGREGDWPRVSLASQKNYISIYLSCATEKGYLAELYKDQLPKCSIGKSCIRFKKLEQMDFEVLSKMLEETKKQAT